MKRTNAPKSGPAHALLPLIPLGAAAVVAGCGGGGGNATPPAPQQNQQPGKSSYATTTALLTITIPARNPIGGSNARGKNYISQGSAAIGVIVGPASMPSNAPSPTTTYYPLPPPGPNPETTTLPVTAPIGVDHVSVSIYDALPGGKAVPNLLSTGSTTANVFTGATEVAVQALGVARGVVLREGAAASTDVLQNDATAQIAKLAATPLDADGFAITGTLAEPVPLSAPSGVTLSPSTLEAAGTVDATYAASQSSIGGRVSAGLPLDTASGSNDNFLLSATQYAFVVSDDDGDGTLSIIDPVARKLVGQVSLPTSGPYGIAAMAGCAGSETVVLATSNGTNRTVGVSVGLPGFATAPTVTDLTTLIAPRQVDPRGASPSYFASDPHCGLYSAADTALHRYSGFPSATGVAIPAAGWTANSSIAYLAGTVYGVTVSTDPEIPENNTAEVQSVPATGGTVAAPGYTFQESNIDDFGLEVGGVFCYSASNCDGGFDDITSIPGLVQSNLETGNSILEDFAVGSNDTVYLAFGNGQGGSGRIDGRFRHGSPNRRSQSSQQANAQRHPATTTGTPPPEVTVNGDAVGASADGRFVVAGSTGTGGAGPTVQIYAASATPGGAPTALGTPIPLGNVPPFISRVVFPR